MMIWGWIRVIYFEKKNKKIFFWIFNIDYFYVAYQIILILLILLNKRSYRYILGTHHQPNFITIIINNNNYNPKQMFIQFEIE